MKRISLMALFVPALCATGYAQNARVISEATIVYGVTIDAASADAELMQSLNGATKTVYIKNSKSRSDLNTPSYTLTVINDTRSDTTVILRQLGNSKFISFLDEAKRQEKNKRYEGITFSPTSETKSILGYNCKKVIAQLKDGSSYSVFYAPNLVPSNRQYEFQFKDLPGLALEYETESEDGKSKFKFTAQKVTLTPVAAALFDLPASGYRVL